MMRKQTLVLGLALISVSMLPSIASATIQEVFDIIEEIPTSRLIKNLQDYIKDHPQDHVAYYELGRVYSVLYVSDKEKIRASVMLFDKTVLPFGVNYETSVAREPLSPKKQSLAPSPKDKKVHYLKLSLLVHSPKDWYFKRG